MSMCPMDYLYYIRYWYGFTLVFCNLQCIKRRLSNCLFVFYTHLHTLYSPLLIMHVQALNMHSLARYTMYISFTCTCACVQCCILSNCCGTVYHPVKPLNWLLLVHPLVHCRWLEGLCQHAVTDHINMGVWYNSWDSGMAWHVNHCCAELAFGLCINCCCPYTFITSPCFFTAFLNSPKLCCSSASSSVLSLCKDNCLTVTSK